MNVHAHALGPVRDHHHIAPIDIDIEIGNLITVLKPRMTGNAVENKDIGARNAKTITMMMTLMSMVMVTTVLPQTSNIPLDEKTAKSLADRATLIDLRTDLVDTAVGAEMRITVRMKTITILPIFAQASTKTFRLVLWKVKIVRMVIDDTSIGQAIMTRVMTVTEIESAPDVIMNMTTMM